MIVFDWLAQLDRFSLAMFILILYLCSLAFVLLFMAGRSNESTVIILSQSRKVTKYENNQD